MQNFIFIAQDSSHYLGIKNIYSLRKNIYFYFLFLCILKGY